VKQPQCAATVRCRCQEVSAKQQVKYYFMFPLYILRYQPHLRLFVANYDDPCVVERTGEALHK